MKHDYVTLNHVQTHLITWGDPLNCNGQDIIICITGNPGITGFYIDFGSHLYRLTGMPVCIIGHAGHEVVPDEKSNVLNGQENLFNLEGQLEHKLEIINILVEKQCRLHLIGHSIGAWLILEFLTNNENLNTHVSSINLLCPTLQKMSKTRNGIFLNNVIRRFHLFFLFLFNLAYFIPSFILNFLVNIYLKLHSLPEVYAEYIMQFLNPRVGEKVLFLAYNEMDIVKNLRTEVLKKVKEKTYVIYSNSDNWAPVSYMEDLHMFQPHIRLQLADIDHAFVLKSSERVAAMVSNFIKLKAT